MTFQWIPARVRVGTIGCTLLLLAAVLLPGPASAAWNVGNWMEADIEVGGPGLQLYPYGSGSNILVTTVAEFNAGTHGYDGVRATTLAASGSLQLGHYGDIVQDPAKTWWDTDWITRQCYELTNTGSATLNDHIFTLPYDTSTRISSGELRTDAGDLRAVDGANAPIDIRSVAPVPSTATSVDVVVPSLAVGATTEVCLYGGNPSATALLNPGAGSTSQLVYYPMNPNYGGILDIVAYENGTVVSIPGLLAPTTVNQGQVLSVNGFTAAHQVEASSPIGGSSRANATDALVPSGFAGLEFVLPSTRNNDQVSVRSPFGTAQVEIYNTGNLVQTLTVSPADGLVTVTSNTSKGLVARSVNGVPILAGGQGNNNDSTVAPPFVAGDTYYGLNSTSLYYSPGVAGATVNWFNSNGGSGSTNLAPNANVRLFGGGRNGGGPGYAFTSNAPFGAIQQADSDGVESTAALPYSLLDDTYYLPQNADYLSFTCPVPGQVITIFDPSGATNRTVPCNGTGVGHAVTNNVNNQFAAGSKMMSAGQFFAYYEKAYNDDETVLIGASAAPAVAASTFVVDGPVEGVHVPAGTWVSPALAPGSTGLVGLSQALMNLPAGTTARFRIAGATSAGAAVAGPFLGPDGTSGTWFDSTTMALPTVLDNLDFYALEVELTTTDPLTTPTVDQVGFEIGLAELTPTGDAHSTLSTVTVPAGASTTSLFRVETPDGTWDGELSWVLVPTPGLFTTLDIGTGTESVTVSGGAITTAVSGLFSTAGSPMISANVDMTAGSTTTVDVKIRAYDVDGAVLEHVVAVPFAS